VVVKFVIAVNFGESTWFQQSIKLRSVFEILETEPDDGILVLL